MLKMNRSPAFWFVLGILWSATFLVMLLEDNLKFHFSHAIIGALAVLSYSVSIFWLVKRKSEENLKK